MKIIKLILVAALLCSIMGCSKKEDIKNVAKQIVTTIFPEYDWVKNILKENPSDIKVEMLLNSGVDLHSFQPTVDDILMISNCDMFIYVGGESDSWVDDVLKDISNDNIIIINLLDELGDLAKQEEIVEGMQIEDEDEDEHEEDEYDEHVWLSLNNAKYLCEVIEKGIERIDSANMTYYRNNLDEYINQLDLLDKQYHDVISKSDKNTLLFGDRFAFRYMVDDYNLNYYAAFMGCSAETEASFETIMFLANKVDELDIEYVMTIDSSDKRIAKTIIDNSNNDNAEILEINSMQSIRKKDIDDGITYLKIMQDNLDVLAKALQ